MSTPETSMIQTLRARFDGPAIDRLGLGCAHLYGGRARSDALQVVAAAVDSGLTYFDTARLYGHGQSESILGEALAGQRDKVVIASKVGILPAAPSLPHRLISKGTSVARKALPVIGRHIPMPKPKQPVFGVFAPHDIRASVETSLRELRTDYLDILLLHECGLEQATDTEVIAVLDDLVASGKIRAYGSATQPDTTLQIAAEVPAGLNIFQFKNDLADTTLAAMPNVPTQLIMTHSHLGRAFRNFTAFLAKGGDPSDIQAAGLDISDPRGVGRKVMAYALAENKGGGVLFSSRKPQMIAKMAGMVELTDETRAAMRRLIQGFNAENVA